VDTPPYIQCHIDKEAYAIQITNSHSNITDATPYRGYRFYPRSSRDQGRDKLYVNSNVQVLQKMYDILREEYIRSNNLGGSVIKRIGGLGNTTGHYIGQK